MPFIPRLLLACLPLIFTLLACTDQRVVHRPLDRLNADVEVLTDEHGIPHIYGKTVNDAVFIQGYVTARDRLFQVEWMRRAASGRLSEVFGENDRETDIFIRAFDFSGRAKQWAATAEEEDPEMWGIILSYVAGFNQFIEDAKTGERGAKLAPMWKELGIEPMPVEPSEILAVDRLITYQAAPGALIELMLELLRQLLPGTFEDLFMVKPPALVSVVPRFLEDLPQSYGPESAPVVELAPATMGTLLKALPKMQNLNQQLAGGSNAWTVAGSHTFAGFPILANDTHQGLGNPPVYYQVHVHAGAEYNAIGLSFPGGPGVQIGHNARLAWGATTNRADDTDIYLETPTVMDGGDGKRGVLFKGEKVALKTREETLRIRMPDGSYKEETLTLHEVPHHGPVFPLKALLGDNLGAVDNLIDALIVSMRWTGLERGFTGSGIRAFFKLSRAHTPDQAEAAFTDYTGGAFNIHYATTGGDTGYHARKMLPIRGCDDRPYMMLIGNGSCEWVGTLPLEAIPHVRNPARGFVVSANNDAGGGTLDGEPENKKAYLGAVYDVGFRAQRIERELRHLTSAGDVRPQDMMTLQADNYSGLAARLVPYLRLALQNQPQRLAPHVKMAAQAVANWDFHTTGVSTEAHLFHAWFGQVLRAMFSDELEAKSDMSLVSLDDVDAQKMQIFVRPLLHFLDATKDILEEIEAGSKPFPSLSGHNYFDDIRTPEIETRDDILLNAFVWAYQQANTAAAERGFDPNWDARRWDAWHTVTLENPSNLPVMKLDPIPNDGGLWTVDVADFNIIADGQLRREFNVRNTASNRSVYLLDPKGIEMWHAIPGGQSEHPDSPWFGYWTKEFYQNLYYKMAFARADVEASAKVKEVFKAGLGGK
jgi:penicillin G amidase